MPREDSVLVNLRALKSLSVDREAEEAEELRLRAEQARRALEEAERLRREEAARIVREAEAAKQRAADEAARVAREDALRLEDAERRARVEAAAKLEETRMRLEYEARAAQPVAPRRAGWWAVGAAMLALAGGGLAYSAYQRSEARRAEADTARAVAEQDAARQRAAADTARHERDERQRQLDEANVLKRRLEEQAPPPAVGPVAKPPRPHVTAPPAAPTVVCICPEGQALCEKCGGK